jgi:hypothetical protein
MGSGCEIFKTGSVGSENGRRSIPFSKTASANSRRLAAPLEAEAKEERDGDYLLDMADETG